MSKLLASDYDGTLRQGVVSQRDLNAIDKFRAAGNKFGIVTGRSIKMICAEIDYYGIGIDFIVGNNGGIAVDNALKTLYAKNIDFDIVRDFIEFMRPVKGIQMGLSDGSDFAPVQGLDPLGYQRKDRNMLVKADPVALETLLQAEIVNSFFIITETNTIAKDLYIKLTETFKDKLSFHYNTGFIDVSAPGVSKAVGVRAIQEHLHPNHTFVIGDAHNDIDMIDAFNGFGISSGADEVKKHASRQFDHIAQCIDFIMALQ